MQTRNSIALNLLVAGITGFAGGYLGVRRDGAEVHDEIRTRRLLIVDEEGEARGGFQTTSSYRAASLWMGWGGDEHPSLALSVDELEGTPTARILARSPGSPFAEPGILSLSSMSGAPAIALTQGADGSRQAVHLGHWMPGETSVLRLERPGETAEWPAR